MKTIIALFAVLLSACAMQPTSEQLAAMAKTDTTPDLCAATLVLSPAAVKAAQNELMSRGATCDWNLARAKAELYLEQKREQQQNAMMALGMGAQMMQQSGPRVLTPAPVMATCQQMGYFTNCQTY